MTLFGPEPGAEPAAGAEPGDDPSTRAPGPGSSRIVLRVAYDGSGFRGFALQPRVPTVAGALAQALEVVIGHPVELTCAGRTDAGVHASGQVVHFDLLADRARAAYAGPVDLRALRRACNRLLAPAVVVRGAEWAPPGFDARHSAQWRRYRYQVLNREDPDPFLARTTWHVEVPLDLRSMQLSCDPVHGEHDFSAFCRRPANNSSTVRRVTRAEWTRPAADLLAFEIVAGAFCHQMVRSLVGTMVDIGRGRKRAGEMAGILRSGERGAAGSPAPAHGLCLEEVGYPSFAVGPA